MSADVAVIGVGRMGLAMCERLVERGFSVLAADRADRREVVCAVGASWAGSVAEAAARAPTAITVLPGPGEVREVMDVIAGALAPGATWIEMSSAVPAVAREAAGRNIRVLDAPVGGNPAAARAGRLIAYVSGAPDDVAAQRAVLEALADPILMMGPAGSGYLAKLLINLLWFGQAVAGAEVLALAARAGLDPERLREAVGHGAAASRFMERDAPRLLAGDDMTSFSLARCHEELLGVMALAGEHGMEMPLAERVAALYGEAVRHYGDVDGELLAARMVTERAGVSFPPRPPAPRPHGSAGHPTLD